LMAGPIAEEINRLLAVSTRETSKSLLSAELLRQKAALPTAPQPPIRVQKAPAQTTFTTVTRYAWDQTKKFVKIYVTLPGLDAASDDAVAFHVDPTTLRVEVTGLAPPASNSRLLVPQLYGEVVVDQCSCSRKPDNMLLLKLRKASDGEEWGSLDDSSHRKAREKEQRLESNKSKSTAELLQEMYRDADEDGKASLSKAWEEGRSKRETRGPS